MRIVPVLVGATLALGWWPASAQKPTFSSKVEVVRVDALVTSGGRPVTGLRASDFDVRDSGVRQQVDLASFEEIPLNVVLALDASGSVAGASLDHLRAASLALVNGLDARDRAALITFNQSVSLGSPLTGDFDQVRQAISRITPARSTTLHDAIFTGLVLAESDIGRSLLIVFTDGADTGSYVEHDGILDAVKRTDVVVYAVASGVGDRRVRGALKGVAEQTGGSLLEVDSTRSLRETFLRILDEFRHRYLLSYTPRGVPRGGWHRIEVRVKGRTLQVKARPGYQAGR